MADLAALRKEQQGTNERLDVLAKATAAVGFDELRSRFEKLLPM